MGKLGHRMQVCGTWVPVRESTSIAQLMRLKAEIAEVIRSVNSMECETLLKMRYLTFLSWDQVAAQLNYSQDYIYHLHRQASGVGEGTGDLMNSPISFHHLPCNRNCGRLYMIRILHVGSVSATALTENATFFLEAL